MCGIVGMAGDLNAKHEQAVRTLLILDSLRGEHSTGVVCVPKYGSLPKVAKQVGDPFQLFDHKSYDKAMMGTQRAIIGHNRYATTGAVNRNNAHPFEHESCVGVHNGTLHTKYLLADPQQYQVDSDNIYHHIDKHGLKDALKYMGGAWTLVWWDKENESINFLRNKERPLQMCWSKDGKSLFWASERWMLYAALGRHGIEYQDIFEMEEDVHFEILIDKNGVMSKPRLTNAPSTYKAAVYVTHTPPAVVPKKEDPATAPVKKLNPPTTVGPEASYISAKQRTIETLGINKDEHGSSYISCFDSQREYFEIRLYAKPKDPVWELIGCDLIANISGFGASGKTPGRGYYKVSPHDFRVIAPVETPDEPEDTITNHRGNLITEAQFRKEYHSCEWCSSALVFGAANRFTTGGQCVCEGCSKDKEVQEYVNFI